MSKGSDRYNALRKLRAITLASDARSIVVEEIDTSTTETISIAAGDYWAHRSSARDTDGYTSLYLALEDALNDAGNTLSGTYSFSAITPSGSSLTDSGLRLSADLDFALRFSNGSSTLDPRLLGFAADTGDQLPTVDGGVYELDSDLSIYGAWQSPHTANDMRDGRTQTVYESSERSPNPRTQAFKGPRTRRMWFFAVEGGHIREDGALNSVVADQADLPVGDVHNALCEFLWEGGLDDELLAVYSGGGLDVPDASYEIVRFEPKKALEDLKGELEDVPGKEQYSFEFQLALTEDSPVYKDP